MRMLIRFTLLLLLMLPAGTWSVEKGLTVKGVRYFSYAAFTRIVFEVEAAAPYVLTRTADGKGLLLSAYDGPFVLKSPLPPIGNGLVKGLESKEDAGKAFIVIRLDAAAGEAKDFVLRGPDRIVVDITKAVTQSAPVAPMPPIDKPVVVVLDAGHGGRDTGMVTAQGQEKMITLELAQAMKKILQKNQRLRVVMTREKDQMLSLDERAAEANAAGAAIFVCIHGAPGTNGRVYIQDLGEDMGGQTARSPNRDFLAYETGSEKQEMVWGMQQSGHAQESGALGRRLARFLAGKDSAEPVQAPLAGLKALDSAAVVIEIGMEQERQKTIEAVAKGIEEYVGENR